MARRLSVTVERFPLAASFTISRGTKTEAVVVRCEIEDEYGRGHGECVPYARYGETVENVQAAIEGVRAAVEGGASRETIQTLLPAGAARNASLTGAAHPPSPCGRQRRGQAGRAARVDQDDLERAAL